MQTIPEDQIISAHVARVAVKIESIHLLQFLSCSLSTPASLSQRCQKCAPCVRAPCVIIPVSPRCSGCVIQLMSWKVVRKNIRPYTIRKTAGLDL